MSENTTTSTPLLDALRALLLAHRSAFRHTTHLP
jgi:hypothetical protein